jgi:hypothetical protein
VSQVMVAGDISSPWGFFFATGLGLAAIAWSILAVTLALRTDSMERASRIAQLYGYTVCLVSLVTILFTVPSMVDNLFQLGQPLYGSDQFPGFAPTLASFDAYKATYERSRPGERGDSATTVRRATTSYESSTRRCVPRVSRRTGSRHDGLWCGSSYFWCLQVGSFWGIGGGSGAAATIPPPLSNPQMQPTGRTGRSSQRAAPSVREQGAKVCAGAQMIACS